MTSRQIFNRIQFISKQVSRYLFLFLFSLILDYIFKFILYFKFILS